MAAAVQSVKHVCSNRLVLLFYAERGDIWLNEILLKPFQKSHCIHSVSIIRQ